MYEVLRIVGPSVNNAKHDSTSLCQIKRTIDGIAIEFVHITHNMQAFRRSAAQTARAVSRQQTKRYAHHEAPAAGSIKYPEEEKLGVRAIGSQQEPDQAQESID